MKITCYETSLKEQKIFQQQFADYEIHCFSEALSESNLEKDTKILCISISSQLTQSVIDTFPVLRGICTRSTGMDHIDIAHCRKKGIIVKNVPAYGVDTIAEHTFALLLALTRNIVPSVERTKDGVFSIEGLQGSQLAGKTLGIIGFGAIGKRVAELAKAFKMNILVYTRTHYPEYEDLFEIKYSDLPSLLKHSDVISIHAPLTQETYHLINTKNIYQMKRGSILINTARGGIIDPKAILMGVHEGILAGVGLDVLEEEHELKDMYIFLTQRDELSEKTKIHLLNHVIIHQQNVIVTPHNAFNSPEASKEIMQRTIENIQELIQFC